MNESDIKSELNTLFEICQDNLCRSQKCQEYLVQERKLSLDSISKFKLGYFPQNVNTLVRYVSPTVLQKLNIIDYSGRSLFSEFFYLVFPILSEYNEPVGMGGRTLLSLEERKFFNLPKYKNSSFKKTHYLYGLEKSRSSILQKRNVYIVEGYFDQIALDANQIYNSVAICGTAFSKNHFLKLAKYADTFTFILDQDDGGQNAMKLIEQKYSNFGLKLKFCELPPGCKDLDDYFRQGGNKEDFQTDLKYFLPKW